MNITVRYRVRLNGIDVYSSISVITVNPPPPPKIVYVYDASGNVIKRELVTTQNSSSTTVAENTEDEASIIDIASNEANAYGLDEDWDDEEETGMGLKRFALSSMSETDAPYANDRTETISANITDTGEFQMIEDENSQIGVTIYPNPTQVFFRVEIAGVDNLKGALIEIFANNGNLVGKWTGISTIQNMNISEQPSGIYFLRLSLEGYVNSWKIVKL